MEQTYFKARILLADNTKGRRISVVDMETGHRSIEPWQYGYNWIGQHFHGDRFLFCDGEWYYFERGQ